jgi:hypothetical protein
MFRIIHCVNDSNQKEYVYITEDEFLNEGYRVSSDQKIDDDLCGYLPLGRELHP